MNGCDTPLPKGRGIKTVLGTEIRECPKKGGQGIPAHVNEWFRLYNRTEGRLSVSDMRVLGPPAIDAIDHIRDTQNRIESERMRLQRERAESERRRAR